MCVSCEVDSESGVVVVSGAYNDFLIDSMVANIIALGLGDEVGDDSHHNDGGDPDDGIANEEEMWEREARRCVGKSHG